MLRLAILALVALTPAVTATAAPKLLSWDDLTNRTKPVPDATIAYGDDHMQKVDLWLPAGPRKNHKPYPTVLMVHGGCWTTSIADRSLMNWVADDLRKAGYAVWNIDYRGVDRAGGGYPGTFLDAAKAADALRDNARKYGLDTRHVVAIGHSAGGHLALWLAARAKLPKDSPLHVAKPLKIAHVISLGGLPDLEATAASPDNGCGTEVVTELLGKPDAARTDIYRDTSVPRLLPLHVPQDLVNGREDSIIPLRLATGYEAQARKAGDRIALHIVPDTGHVELVTPDTAAWTKTKALLSAAISTPSR